MEKPPVEATIEFSFLYAHPPIKCPGINLEPIIEQTIKAVSRGEAVIFAREKTVKGTCGHIYELSANPPK